MIEELKKIILDEMEMYIISSFFGAFDNPETETVMPIDADGLLRQWLNSSIDSRVAKYTKDIPPREIAALKDQLFIEGMEMFDVYKNDRASLYQRKYELEIKLEALASQSEELDPMWRDITDALRMTDAEKDYETFIQRQAELNQLAGDPAIWAAVGSLMDGQYWGIVGNPAIGQRNFGAGGTIPLFTVGLETNLYADSILNQNGMTWLQDIQVALIELGLIGQYEGTGDDRTLYAVNQLDDVTLRGIQELMGILNRSGTYLPTSDQLVRDMLNLGIDTAILDEALAGGDPAAISSVFQTIAQSKEGKQLFHQYLLDGANKLIQDKGRTGMDTQVILLPSEQARISEAKTKWREITGTQMNPYLAAVAAEDIRNIYEQVQSSEGDYMGPYSQAAYLYEQQQKSRVKNPYLTDTIYKPYSDPMTIINQKIADAITNMAIKDNEEFVSGNVQRSYGTNLWNILTSLG